MFGEKEWIWELGLEMWKLEEPRSVTCQAARSLNKEMVQLKLLDRRYT